MTAIARELQPPQAASRRRFPQPGATVDELDPGGFESLANGSGVNRCSDSLSIEQFRSHDGVER